MTKYETLAQHTKELNATKTKMDDLKNQWKTLEEEWAAKNTAFNTWVATELNITDVKGETHLAEILTKWSGTGSRLIL